MRIMHYALGYPPYRSGGLTKFSIDLANNQAKDGNQVMIMWPGRYLFNKKKLLIKIKKHQSTISFELCNPMPVPLLNGIVDFNSYEKTHYSVEFFLDFLVKLRLDVIHVHSLMGLPREFIQASKLLNIKLVFTTHDYFGICPRTNLFFNHKICDGIPKKDCINCCSRALPLKAIRFMQSGFYQMVKNSSFFSFLRKYKREKYSKDDNQAPTFTHDKDYSKDYKTLQNYYISMLNEFDLIHCNSSVAFNVYSRFLDSNKLFVRNITHNSIGDYRFTKIFDKSENKLRILYLGPENEIKGFPKLIKLLDKIWEKYKNFVLVVYSNDDICKRDYLEKHGSYLYSNLKDIFSKTDVMVAISSCQETFGYTVLEAYSYGVPSIVAANVGAKDIVSDGRTGFIVADDNEFLKTIVDCIEQRDKIIPNFIENIKKDNFNFSMDNFYDVYDRNFRE